MSADRERALALAHALRTPLTSIVLGLGLLDEGTVGPLTPEQREVVTALVDDIARLQRLVDGALNTDRLGSYAGPLERTRVDLGDVVVRAVEPIARQAEARRVAIARRCAPGVVVSADPVKLGWVVAAIAGNALRYSPEGSSIGVTVRAAAEGALVEIRDRGPGIPIGIRAALFDRRATHGLTLPLAREILDAHGGSIRVEARRGGGSTFRIGLPLAATGTAARGTSRSGDRR